MKEDNTGVNNFTNQQKIFRERVQKSLLCRLVGQWILPGAWRLTYWDFAINMRIRAPKWGANFRVRNS
jgi:hypothetical protein